MVRTKRSPEPIRKKARDPGDNVSELAAKLDKLNRALRHFGPAETREVLLESVLNVAEGVFGLDTAALLLLEPEGRLRVAASRGYRPEAVQAYHARLGEGVAGTAALEGPPGWCGMSRRKQATSPVWKRLVRKWPCP